MTIDKDRARMDMKKLDYLLRDSQMSNEVSQLVNALSDSCINFDELLTIYSYRETLANYFNGQINIYDVMLSIVEQCEAIKE
jgi:hypothetical protein